MKCGEKKVGMKEKKMIEISDDIEMIRNDHDQKYCRFLYTNRILERGWMTLKATMFLHGN